MEENKKTPSKVGDLITVLVPTALIADALSLIPFVGNVVAPAFWVFASLYIWGKGFGLMNLKRLVPALISVIAEFVPVVQEFPTIITAVVVIIVSVSIEEKTGVNILKNPTEALSAEGLGRNISKGLKTFGTRKNLPQGNKEKEGKIRSIQPMQNRLGNSTSAKKEIKPKEKPAKDSEKIAA